MAQPSSHLVRTSTDDFKQDSTLAGFDLDGGQPYKHSGGEVDMLSQLDYTGQMRTDIGSPYFLSSLTNQFQFQQQLFQQQQQLNNQEEQQLQRQSETYEPELQGLRKSQELTQLQSEFVSHEQMRREQAEQDLQLRQLEKSLYQNQKQVSPTAGVSRKVTSGGQPTSSLPLHSSASEHPTQLWLLGDNLLCGSGNSTTPNLLPNSIISNSNSKLSMGSPVQTDSLPSFGSLSDQCMFFPTERKLSLQQGKGNGNMDVNNRQRSDSQETNYQQNNFCLDTDNAPKSVAFNQMFGNTGVQPDGSSTGEDQAQSLTTSSLNDMRAFNADVMSSQQMGVEPLVPVNEQILKAEKGPGVCHNHEFDRSSGNTICAWSMCGQTVPIASLLDHLRQQHGHNTNGQWICYWNGCKLAQEPMASAQVYLHHFETHLEGVPYICKHQGCGQSFTLSAMLAEHSKLHSGDKPFTCEVQGCGKQFSYANCLVAHNRSHTGEKPRVCIVCGKRFSGLSNLTAHMRTHTGERPYKCKYDRCGKSFTTSSDLVRHTRIHTGQKPFACQAVGCGKRFTTSSQLNNHTRTHTGEKPYWCKTVGCEKRFADLTTLRRHEQAHERKRKAEPTSNILRAQAVTLAKEHQQAGAQNSQPQQNPQAAMQQSQQPWYYQGVPPHANQPISYAPKAGTTPPTYNGYMPPSAMLNDPSGLGTQQHRYTQENAYQSSQQNVASTLPHGQPIASFSVAPGGGQPTNSLNMGAGAQIQPQRKGSESNENGGSRPLTGLLGNGGQSGHGAQAMGSNSLANNVSFSQMMVGPPAIVSPLNSTHNGQQPLDGALAAAHLLTALSNSRDPNTTNNNQFLQQLSEFGSQHAIDLLQNATKRPRLEVESMGHQAGSTHLPNNLGFIV